MLWRYSWEKFLKKFILYYLHAGYFFMLFLSSADFLLINFLKRFFQEHFHGVKLLYPDQDWHLVGPDLGSNCLQGLSANDKSGRSWKSKKTADDKKHLKLCKEFSDHFYILQSDRQNILPSLPLPLPVSTGTARRIYSYHGNRSQFSPSSSTVSHPHGARTSVSICHGGNRYCTESGCFYSLCDQVGILNCLTCILQLQQTFFIFQKIKTCNIAQNILQLLTIEADMMWCWPESTNIDWGRAEVNIGILRSTSHLIYFYKSATKFRNLVCYKYSGDALRKSNFSN